MQQPVGRDSYTITPSLDVLSPRFHMHAITLPLDVLRPRFHMHEITLPLDVLCPRFRMTWQECLTSNPSEHTPIPPLRPFYSRSLVSVRHIRSPFQVAGWDSQMHRHTSAGNRRVLDHPRHA